MPVDPLPTSEMVAELRKAAREWKRAASWEIRVNGGSTEDSVGMNDRAKMYRRAAALIEQQAAELAAVRAAIERAERERDAAVKQAGDLSEGIAAALGLPWIGSRTGGFRLPDDKTLIAAAEARVTALEAKKAGLVEALENIQKPTSPERLAGSHLTLRGRGQLAFAMIDHFQSTARQALSRSSTEDRS